MTTRRSWIACVRAALLVVLLAGWATAAQDAPRFGGVLKAAMIGEPPTLDTHTTTATIAYQIGWRDLLDPKLRGVHGAGREA
jgi:hypothetical protein